MNSPALSGTTDVDLDDMTDEELDMYFASYVPLSNLPTPPPTKDAVHSQLENLEASTLQAQQCQTPELEVYATYLSKLVPTNASPQRPSVDVVRGFLERASLPDEIVAFSASILDALSQRFASSWRAALVPYQQDLFFQLTALPTIAPEVIVLASLALAHGFLADLDRSSKRWVQLEGASLFTVRELEATKWCILADIDYGLSRISDNRVQRMLKDMQHATNFSRSNVSMTVKPSTLEKGDKRPKLNLEFAGTAVWQNGVHTPEPSP